MEGTFIVCEVLSVAMHGAVGLGQVFDFVSGGVTVESIHTAFVQLMRLSAGSGYRTHARYPQQV